MDPTSAWTVLNTARELAECGQRCALATVVWRQSPSSGQPGCRAVITADGELHGWIGGACAEPTVIREARAAIASGETRLLSLGTSDKDLAGARAGVTSVAISCQSEGALEVYIEPILPVPHLIVEGRSPLAGTLGELARGLGWRATVGIDIDVRAAAGAARPCVVIATQGENDEDALERALAADPAYVGLVSSARRGQAVLGYLADRGVARAALDQVQVPAGLDLGPVAHTEIAAAILAELVRRRAAGELPIAPTEPAAAPAAEATDPICGMTVEVGPRTPSLARAEQTYYFCCPGCRAAFEQASPPAKEALC